LVHGNLLLAITSWPTLRRNATMPRLPQSMTSEVMAVRDA
jgi:hypothetical protein